MSSFSSDFGSELYSATQEYVDLRYEAVAQQLGGIGVEAAFEEEATANEVFASLTDEEQELYLEQEMARADDDEYMSHLLTLPQSQVTLATMDFLHTAVQTFGRVEGYQLSGVEAGRIELVANPIDLDNDAETLLDATLVETGEVALRKRNRRATHLPEDDDPYVIEHLIPTDEDTLAAKQAVAKLLSVNKYLRASLEI